MRTGKRRSASVIISRGLPGIKFLICSIPRLHSSFAVSSRLAPPSRPRYARAMCGRARLSSDVSEIKLVFSVPPHRPTPDVAPSWNVAPTDPLPIARYDARAGERALDVIRWGLVPFWAKDIKVGFANINAKAEGIEGKPAFREAFQWRRCLVPGDNFYEWKKTAMGKQPYAIALADRGLMALAGLWGSRVGSHQPPAERQRLSSFTRILILIVAANRGTIHSEYVGKTTGPETTLVANRLVGVVTPWSEPREIAPSQPSSSRKHPPLARAGLSQSWRTRHSAH